MPKLGINNYHRQSMRMRGYDYSLEGAYFVTIATYQRRCLFGEVINGEVILNAYGKIAYEQWIRLGRRFSQSNFSIFAIMPNHVHGIIHIVSGVGEGFDYASPGIPTRRPYNGEDIVPYSDKDFILRSLGVIIRAYKAAISYRINAIRGITKPPVWQRNYYDHIIRNEKEYQQIKDYIETNPATWTDDRFYAPEITE